MKIPALTENGFKAVPTELCDFTDDHPISKIHNQELVLSPAQRQMPLFQFQRKLLLFESVLVFLLP